MYVIFVDEEAWKQVEVEILARTQKTMVHLTSHRYALNPKQAHCIFTSKLLVSLI